MSFQNMQPTSLLSVKIDETQGENDNCSTKSLRKLLQKRIVFLISTVDGDM